MTFPRQARPARQVSTREYNVGAEGEERGAGEYNVGAEGEERGTGEYSVGAEGEERGAGGVFTPRCIYDVTYMDDVCMGIQCASTSYVLLPTSYVLRPTSYVLRPTSYWVGSRCTGEYV